MSEKSDDDNLNGWTDLRVPPEELRPSASLTIGQCFNWRQAAPDCWVGVLGREVVAIRWVSGKTREWIVEIAHKLTKLSADQNKITRYG